MVADHPAIAALRKQELDKYNQGYFAEHYWREDLPGKTGNRSLSYDDPDHEQRFQFLFDVLIKDRARSRILDAGCGPGLLLQKMLSAGADAYGIDSSLHAVRAFEARHGVPTGARVTLAHLHRIPFSDNAFEFSICLDVLEHLIVFDVLQAVTELCRVTSRRLICSINLDNPYRFHPTILSRESWGAAFESTNLVQLDVSETDRLNSLVKAKYEEYDLFVFRKL
jgi:2-polyprenyl-3-methyl-5-hydroxy-6-metoxy-1,4-benzoquinol methylase